MDNSPEYCRDHGKRISEMEKVIFMLKGGLAVVAIIAVLGLKAFWDQSNQYVVVLEKLGRMDERMTMLMQRLEKQDAHIMDRTAQK